MIFGRKQTPAAPDEPAQAGSLKQAMREARVDAAERTGVVVDLRDAEMARLELLNEALDPLFAEIPPEIDLFDRGISRGRVPRLWLDSVAHVAMGHDKRVYRVLQDTRYGRKVLAESTATEAIVKAVTHYIAGRVIERERALDGDGGSTTRASPAARQARRRRRWRMLKTAAMGFTLGIAALFTLLWIAASRG